MNKVFDDRYMSKSLVIYPPLSNGILIEEYMHNNANHPTKKLINVNWTNIFVNKTFRGIVDVDEKKLQEDLDNLDPEIEYYTVVQMDDGILFRLPPKTTVYGCCTNIPIPLIYETDFFSKINKIKNKSIFCSFVGSLTHDVRRKMVDILSKDSKYKLYVKEWSPNLNENHINKFIEVSLNSKFVLAPRGYGRNSFRLWEVLELGAIPIYIWDDTEFLPRWMNIDFDKLCISININNIDNLSNILSNITDIEYISRLEYYNLNKNLFTYEGICNSIIKLI
jgi:hypothetical protein